MSPPSRYAGASLRSSAGYSMSEDRYPGASLRSVVRRSQLRVHLQLVAAGHQHQRHTDSQKGEIGNLITDGDECA